MASVDSGVETGNESNDGPLDTKNEAQIEQMPLPAIGPSRVQAMLPDETVAVRTMSGCIFGPGLPHFKLPHSSLPPGFGESYGVHPPDRSRSLVVPYLKDKPPRNRLWMVRKRSDWADWQWTDSLIERKLRVAVSTNNIELVQNYLFAGVNPNCVDSMGRSPLHLAACSGYADIVRLLLENGANPNQRDRLGNTPLHLAACTNNIVVVTLLLKAGTDVCSSDLHGRSPLQLAQSKLKLLQKHMGGDGIVKNYVRNQAFQVSLPKLQHIAPIDEIPVYDNAFIAKQALQIVEMMRLFLQKRGQETEAELLNAFSSRLTLSETKEQVETQVRDLLDSLSGLSLDSACEDDSAVKPSSSINSSSCIVRSNSGMNIFPNPHLPSCSPPPCSFVPSISHSPGGTFPNGQ